MKRIALFLTIIAVVLPAGVFAATLGGPLCTQDAAWESVLDNAYRLAEEYAIDNNPRSTFITSMKDYSFVKQIEGTYKGEYLLEITTAHGKDYSVAVLRPLFDVDQTSAYLDTDKPLWEVVSATFNGKSY